MFAIMAATPLSRLPVARHKQHYISSAYIYCHVSKPILDKTEM